MSNNAQTDGFGGERRELAMLGERVVDPAQWSGQDMAAREDWCYELNAAQCDALMAMAAGVRKHIGDDANALLTMPREDFDLGECAPLAATIKRDLTDGRGFALLRGLPMDDVDLIDSAIMYWGMGRALGQAVSNNPDGDMIGHVTDLGKDMSHPKHRGYQTRAGMDYHTDQSTVVGLLCFATARSGGLSKIASSVAVYNTLIERRPDLLEPLSQPYYWSKLGETDRDDDPFYLSPVFNLLYGYLCTSFGPNHMIKGHALEEAPALTDAQGEALEVVEQICEELHLSMELRRGDIQFLNNMVIMHTRTGFEDWPEPERKRRLWRLWLDVPGIRPLTPFLEQWHGGLKLKDTRERIELTPS